MEQMRRAAAVSAISNLCRSWLSWGFYHHSVFSLVANLFSIPSGEQHWKDLFSKTITRFYFPQLQSVISLGKNGAQWTMFCKIQANDHISVVALAMLAVWLRWDGSCCSIHHFSTVWNTLFYLMTFNNVLHKLLSHCHAFYISGLIANISMLTLRSAENMVGQMYLLNITVFALSLWAC